MKITVVGTGYVGLVTGACFAEMGNHVVCVDVDEKKVSDLRAGRVSIYEPGLEEIVLKNSKEGRLNFTATLQDAIQDASVCFIAVGTPPEEDGSADLRYVLAVAREIGEKIKGPCIVVDKSTVPVGTAEKVRATIQQQLDERGEGIYFDVVSNPEFLKEGAAVNDFMSPDRIVIGADSQKARETMAELYAPFVRNHPRIVYMRVRDAEMTKYAANAMLATKISFMNEIANLCETLDVDVENVRLGIGSDHRIGFDFIYPGAGYGGSCFPKDVRALIEIAQKNNFNASLLKAVESRNNSQKLRLFEKVKNWFGDDLHGKIIAIWGLSFKPGTDDMREAPSRYLIDELVKAGVRVRVYDPVVNTMEKSGFPSHYESDGSIVFCVDQYDATVGADALVLVTEWKPFRHPDFRRLQFNLKTPLIFDGRNQYDPDALKQQGFRYFGIGR